MPNGQSAYRHAGRPKCFQACWTARQLPACWTARQLAACWTAKIPIHCRTAKLALGLPACSILPACRTARLFPGRAACMPVGPNFSHAGRPAMFACRTADSGFFLRLVFHSNMFLLLPISLLSLLSLLSLSPPPLYSLSLFCVPSISTLVQPNTILF